MTPIVAKASIQIRKPIAEVFEAIVDPAQMKHYFISEGSGRLASDKTVMWKFPEFEETFPVTGKVIQPSVYISFDWSGGATNMLVEIFLAPFEAHYTVVRILEKQMDATQEGIQQAIGQTEGWANFLACLKAYLEYNINLRQGAFDFMHQQES